MTINAPLVWVGGSEAPVVFSGLAPGFVGLYQVDVIIPDASATGRAIPVSMDVGGASSDVVTIAVE
jgi:minor extracellular serine protease Vpr